MMFLFCLFCFSLNSQTLPADQHIDNLIKRMTLEEKAGQLNFLVGETIVTGPSMYTSESAKFDDQIKAGTVTGLFNVHGAAYTARLQKIAVEQSRLGIPLLFGADIIHGFKTVTPIPLGEAASWDLGLIESSARLAADEATSSGINLNFAPMVDISRDPRWGRISEGAGEDPYLGSRIAEARVRGFQGTSLALPSTLAACVKHFAAYGAPDGGRDYNTVDMSHRMLLETYLPPFQAAIKAGAASIMPSFNELDGIPATGNKALLQDLLRKELKFRGLVISDYGAIGETINHGVASTGDEAVALCLKAGTDLDMMSFLFITKIPLLVKSGKLDERIVDEAVRRVLKLKWDLGLFQNPYLYSDVEREHKTVRSREKLEQARSIAKRSMVLLKNEGQLLPLSKNIKKIAIIGPLAANKEDMNGSWSFFGEPGDPVSVLEGIKAKVSPGTVVSYHRGCNLYDQSLKAIDSAVSIARNADVIVVVVGESAVMNGEGASRSDIGLPGGQLELIQAIHKTDRPVVVMLVNGRPLALNWIHENVPAILETWTGGSETGNAVADILFGDYNPSGKLPVTFPRSAGQIPIYYSHKNTGRPYSGANDEPLNQRMYVSKYRDVPNSPLYPFGFGLSYSTFVYGDILLSQPVLKKGGKISATIQIRNSSTRDGEEVVQLYIRDRVGSVTRPVKELKGFQKISLKAGESRVVTFTLTPEDLAFYRADMTWGSEPGTFDLFIGGSSEDVKNISFELKDESL
jgi:beta-glucosidase